MRTIKKEIAQCMYDLDLEDNHILTAHFVFPEDFIGFQGHFPENKILPGICQIQCVIAMLEEWKKKKVVLKEIVLAKFLLPVRPFEELACTGQNIEESNGELALKVLFSKSGKKTAEIKLKVRVQ